MTKTELIKQLESVDGNPEVVFCCTIESGRGSSSSVDGGISLDMEEEFEYYDCEEEKEFNLGEKLVVSIYGERTSYE